MFVLIQNANALIHAGKCYTNHDDMSVTKLPKQRIKGFTTCVVSIKVSKSIAILLVSRYIEVSSVSPSTTSQFTSVRVYIYPDFKFSQCASTRYLEFPTLCSQNSQVGFKIPKLINKQTQSLTYSRRRLKLKAYVIQFFNHILDRANAITI